MAGPSPEVPERRVLHDVDDTDDDRFGSLVGEAQTLPMSSQAKAAAKRRRANLEKLGGFGFRT